MTAEDARLTSAWPLILARLKRSQKRPEADDDCHVPSLVASAKLYLINKFKNTTSTHVGQSDNDSDTRGGKHRAKHPSGKVFIPAVHVFCQPQQTPRSMVKRSHVKR